MAAYVLGVDVGGTKCHALICDEHGRALALGAAGTGNPEVVGYDGLAAVLTEITAQAARQAGITIDQIAAAGMGICGYDWPSQRDVTLQAVRATGLTCPIEIVNDAMIGLIAGAEAGWGVGLVAGTGSNCRARDRQGREGRAVGMGYGLGEDGGAGAMVYAAFKAVVQAWACRGMPTHLTSLFLNVSGLPDAAALIEAVVTGRFTPTPALAPRIFEIAAAGDEAARRVITTCARELGEMALGAARQVHIQNEAFDVVLVGGLFQGGDLLLDPLRSFLQRGAPLARLVRLTAPPVTGGALLALEMAGLNPTPRRAVLFDSVKNGL